MAQKDLFTSPMAKKKTVDLKYSPNTYRVISGDAENWVAAKPRRSSTFSTTSSQNLIGQPPDQYRPEEEFRYNRPNANHVGFLRHNVKLLNEPVCDAHTIQTAPEQHLWWPHRTSKQPLKKPEHTLDTTVRSDYQWWGNNIINTRHSSNPHKRPVLGAVPVNFLRDPSGQQRLLKEGISYEHQYDARGKPSYPPRGKRHGAFVWDQFSKDHAERFTKCYSNLGRPASITKADSSKDETCLQESRKSSCGEPAGDENFLPPICT